LRRFPTFKKRDARPRQIHARTGNADYSGGLPWSSRAITHCHRARVAVKSANFSTGHTRMNITGIPFGVTAWSDVPPVEYPGVTGKAVWRTREFGGMRVRMVEYSAGYLADHWCSKGHIVLVLEGEFESELEDGRKFRLTPGMSYQVADNAEAHRSYTATGVKLFIVD
jgi:hypothetical protein